MTGSLSIRTANVHSEATTLENPCVRSSSCARPAVAVSEYSGLPVTTVSTRTHTTGPIAASAR